MSKSIRYVWKQIPLYRAIWPFIGGVIVGVFFPDLSIVWSLIIASIALLAMVIAVKNGIKGYVNNLLLIAVLLMGYAVTVIHTDRVFQKHFSHLNTSVSGYYIGELISDPIPRERSIKTEVEITHYAGNRDTIATQGKVLVYFQPNEASRLLRYGDQIAFPAKLNKIPEPQNPSEFNYQRYMHFHQVSSQAYLDSASWSLVSIGPDGLRKVVFEWQHRVIQHFESFEITDRELAIISALLVGYKHHLSSDQVNAFASAGAMHVLAVSGLHVGIIYLIINTLLKVLDRSRSGRVIKGILMILILWFYALLTGLSPSVTRAATMFTFVIAARQFHRHTDIFNTLASSAFALLVYDPFLIVEVGFQLSYLAVLGIVLLQPKIYDLWKPKLWIVDKMWAITAVSLAAQAATFPLALLYFHQFPNYFLLSNLVVIPAATFILPLGIALIAFGWVPYLSVGLAWLLYHLVHWLDLFIQWVQQLPYALLLGIDISIFETYLIYMIVAALCAFLMTKRYSWLALLVVSITVVEVANIIESKFQNDQKLVVFYKVRGFDAIDFIVGKQHHFLADSALEANFDKMRFHIHHHWWSRDLEPSSEEIPELYQNEPWIVFDSLRIVQLDSGDYLSFDSKVSTDYLYIKQRTMQYPKVILDQLEIKQIILSANLDWSSHRLWMKLCDEHGIPVHSLREQGAFVRHLN